MLPKGPFTWREEDTNTRKIPEGGSTFTLGLHAEILVRVVHKFRMFEKELQSSQVKRTPQNAVNEFITRKLSPLAVVDFTFISTFLHA